MSNSFLSLLSNSVVLDSLREFSAIIGEAPSKGARSPILWKRAFKALEMQVEMHPFDVSSSNLKRLVTELSGNSKFVGGCVAIPYKENICTLLGNNVSKEASAIGAVNSLYRDEKGHLFGTNTDGEAALLSLQEKLGSLTGKNILVLGGGGAGKSLCPYIANSIAPNGSLFLACRKNFPTAGQLATLGVEKAIQWHDIKQYASEINILINCTSKGHLRSDESSPLSLKELASFKHLSLVYDIIYDPSPTTLLKYASSLNIDTLDGLPMNLEQAVLAFHYAIARKYKDLSCDKIREFMIYN